MLENIIVGIGRSLEGKQLVAEGTKQRRTS
jgi:hypothetical protein